MLCGLNVTLQVDSIHKMLLSDLSAPCLVDPTASVFDPASVWNVFYQIKRLNIIQCASPVFWNHILKTQKMPTPNSKQHFLEKNGFSGSCRIKCKPCPLKMHCVFSLAKRKRPCTKKMLIINFSSHIFYFGPSVSFLKCIPYSWVKIIFFQAWRTYSGG